MTRVQIAGFVRSRSTDEGSFVSCFETKNVDTKSVDTNCVGTNCVDTNCVDTKNIESKNINSDEESC